MTTADRNTLHHRYRGEELERYRIALYAQSLAQRDGLPVPDAMLNPDTIEIEWTKNNRPRAVTFHGASFDLRIKLPLTNKDR